MKKIFFFLFLFPFALHAQTLNGMSDAQQLGTIAGLALACNAGNRLDDFQLISSYIIANQATSEAQRKKAFEQFAEEKMRTYNMQKAEPRESCKTILEHFYNMPIFGATVYADGTVKFSDGRILKPYGKLSPKEKKKKQEKASRNYMIPPRQQ